MKSELSTFRLAELNNAKMDTANLSTIQYTFPISFPYKSKKRSLHNGETSKAEETYGRKNKAVQIQRNKKMEPMEPAETSQTAKSVYSNKINFITVYAGVYLDFRDKTTTKMQNYDF